MFVVTSLNTDTLFSAEVLVNQTLITLAPPPSGRGCPLYEFTVQSRNDFNRSRSGVSQRIHIPTGEGLRCQHNNYYYVRIYDAIMMDRWIINVQWGAMC